MFAFSIIKRESELRLCDEFSSIGAIRLSISELARDTGVKMVPDLRIPLVEYNPWET